MNDFTFSDLTIRPLTDQSLDQVEELFKRYPFKDFQLQQLDIPKAKMVSFLRQGLFANFTKAAGLREGGRLIGLIGVSALPWMSGLFGARMFTIRHFLTDDMGQGYFQTMIRYVLDQVEGVDFLDCRVATGDINAIHALENSGFRYVGNEIYLARSLVAEPVPEDYAQADCVACPDRLKEQVLSLVERTHSHNRFMYDPEVSHEQAANIFRKYVSGIAFKEGYRTLIQHTGDRVDGFIIYKFTPALSAAVGGNYASLDFIGVNRESQNKGIGECLNRAALHDLARSGATHVVVRTFGSNYPAIRILHKVGFKITSSDLHFHHWIRANGSS